jgi:segregation and condensation protein B
MKEIKNTKSIIESLLFVAEKPVSIKELAEASGIMSSEIQKHLKEIAEDFKEKGIRLIKKDENFHFATAPENSKEVSALLNEELRNELSPAAIEVLAIITYKQPITRGEIEEIRGVNSDYLVKNLLIRGLICEVGRKETVGKPVQYGTTLQFINFFGLHTDENIPKLEEILAQNQTLEVDGEIS